MIIDKIFVIRSLLIMNFRIKLLATWILEIIPFKENIYYFLQKNITKSLEINQNVFNKYNHLASNHLSQYFKRYKSYPNNVLDFGTGWILAFPLIMSKYCKNVYATDIKCLARKEINLKVESFLNIPLDNIKYITPCDITSTDFKDNSFDLITSNSVLEHIPKKSIKKVAEECFRLLSKNGICSFNITHQDHWSFADKNISKMNYLKFPAWKWFFYNPPLNFQNRLLQSDYISIFEEAGFKYEVKSITEKCDVKVNKFFKNNPKSDMDIIYTELILYK